MSRTSEELQWQWNSHFSSGFSWEPSLSSIYMASADQQGCLADYCITI